MPAKDREHVVMSPEARAHLKQVRALMRASGEPMPHDSAVWRWALGQVVALTEDMAYAERRVRKLRRELAERGAALEALRARPATETRPHDGARLRAARVAAGLSQSELAAVLGYEHRSSVGNVEVGRAPLEGRALAWVERHEKGKDVIARVSAPEDATDETARGTGLPVYIGSPPAITRPGE